MSFFFGGKFLYNNFGIILEVPVPAVLAAVILLQIILADVSAFVSLLYAFKYKKDNGVSGAHKLRADCVIVYPPDCDAAVQGLQPHGRRGALLQIFLL